MQKLQEELQRVFYRLSNPLEHIDYYGLSFHPLKIEETLLNQGAYWSKKGWCSTKKVDLSEMGLILLPKFHIVEDDFLCFYNNLISLEGSPKTVEKWYSCHSNPLKSLKGSPEQVGYFVCSNTLIKDLVGAPEKCLYEFSCHNCKLTSLKGAPNKVDYFRCFSNRLKDLQGVPSALSIDATDNPFDSLNYIAATYSARCDILYLGDTMQPRVYKPNSLFFSSY